MASYNDDDHNDNNDNDIKVVEDINNNNNNNEHKSVFVIEHLLYNKNKAEIDTIPYPPKRKFRAWLNQYAIMDKFRMNRSHIYYHSNAKGACELCSTAGDDDGEIYEEIMESITNEIGKDEDDINNKIQILNKLKKTKQWTVKGKCMQCGVHLHPDCFDQWHKIGSNIKEIHQKMKKKRLIACLTGTATSVSKRRQSKQYAQYRKPHKKRRANTEHSNEAALSNVHVVTENQTKDDPVNQKNNENTYIIEACVDSINSAINAIKGGANRLEICSNLYEGGVTPSYGLIKCIVDYNEKLINNNKVEINCLIRPRAGDFVYNKNEIQSMINDIKMCKSLKIDGVVLGCLTENGDIDYELLKLLLTHCKPQLSVTFHRAIDLCKSPIDCVKKLSTLQIDRILTSGGHNSAYEGKDIIKDMVEIANKSSNTIKIMAGGGITLDNVVDIIKTCKVREIHGTFRSFVDGKMKYRKNNVYMGGEKKNCIEAEYGRKECDTNTINHVRQLLN